VTPETIAAELLAAYGRADGSHHVLEARLEAACGGYRPATYALLAARERAARCGRRRYVAPFDPGLVLARTIVAASSSPATQRPRPRPAASPMWRVGGDLALCFVAVALPLACGLLVDRWIR